MIKIYFVIVVSLLVTACELPQQRREIERQKLDRALADPSLTYEQKVDLIRRSMASKPGYVSYRPVIDPASCKNCNYEGDLIQCQAILGIIPIIQATPLEVLLPVQALRL